MDVIHELTAQYDSRKSFYGKAMTDGGTEIERWSVQKARV